MSKLVFRVLVLILVSSLSACGGGGGGNSTPTQTSTTTPTANTLPVIKEGAATSVNMSINSYPTPFKLTLDATDADNDALTWSISNKASNGTASVTGSGSAGTSTATVSYAPNTNYIGTDTFNVQVSDGHTGGTAAIKVNVTVATSNTTPVTVDAGPSVLTSTGTYTYNRPFVSVKICNTSGNCQVIDHIMLDTGSVGLRVLASAFDKSKLDYTTLPPYIDTFSSANTNLPVAECYQFVNSHMWGTLRMASVQVGGEVTTNPIPIEVVSDSTAGNITSACASIGSDWGQIGNLYANGILGVQFFNSDCGAACAATPPSNTVYYTCKTPSDATTCTAINVPTTNQVPNPVTQFAINSQGGQDTNGVEIQMPPVTNNTGDATSTGTLYFGVGTQTNNALGSATILPVTSNGLLPTLFNGDLLCNSVIDSGTSNLYFPQGTQGTGNNTFTTPPLCTNSTFYCPATGKFPSFPATIEGTDGTQAPVVSFKVANPITDLPNSPTATAFNDVASSIGTVFNSIDSSCNAVNATKGSFIWGMPFFYGRSVFVVFDQAAVSGISSTGPFVAF